MAIWYFHSHFLNYIVNWYIFNSFGIFYRFGMAYHKSGNPDKMVTVSHIDFSPVPQNTAQTDSLNWPHQALIYSPW
jgi:hypothetical protein